MNTRQSVSLIFILFLSIIITMAGCTLIPEPIPNTYTITATAGAHGQIDPEGEVTLNEGESQSFTITPNTGYAINEVLVDGISVGAVTNYTFPSIQQDHTIQASFVQQAQDSFTITSTAGTGGSIHPKGNIKVNKGDNQSFIITPNIGYEIDDILVDNSSQGPITFYTFKNVQKNHIIHASFLPNEYTVTVSIDPPMSAGAVYGGGTYNVGDTVQITAVDNPGSIYYFDYWYDQVNNQKIYTEIYTFTMPAVDMSFIAYFDAPHD